MKLSTFKFLSVNLWDASSPRPFFCHLRQTAMFLKPVRFLIRNEKNYKCGLYCATKGGVTQYWRRKEWENTTSMEQWVRIDFIKTPYTPISFCIFQWTRWHVVELYIYWHKYFSGQFNYISYWTKWLCIIYHCVGVIIRRSVFELWKPHCDSEYYSIPNYKLSICETRQVGK